MQPTEALLNWLLGTTLAPANPVTIAARMSMLATSEASEEMSRSGLPAMERAWIERAMQRGLYLRGLLKSSNRNRSAWNPDGDRLVEVEISASDGGSYRLATHLCGRCGHRGHGGCIHAMAALGTVALNERSGAAAALWSPQTLANTGVGASAAGLLDLIDRLATAKVPNLPSDSRETSRSSQGDVAASAPVRGLTYTLSIEGNNLARYLSLEGRQVLKGGGWSSKCRPIPWDALHAVWSNRGGGASGATSVVRRDAGPHGNLVLGNYDVPLTLDDEIAAKQLFVAAGLASSDRLDLLGKKTAEAIKALIATQRLLAAGERLTTLKAGAPRAARATWQRKAETRLWRLVLEVDGGAGVVIPSDPPWFVDLNDGVIGALVGQWTADTFRAIAAADDIAESDLPLLQETLGPALANLRLPKIPTVRVERRGKLTPQPFLYLSWRFEEAPHFPAADNREVLRYRSAEDGQALAALRFNYEGISVHGPGEEVTFAQGDDTIIYQRDLDFERRCIALVSRQGQLMEAEEDIYQWEVAYGSFAWAKTSRDIRAYHGAVVPEARRGNWKVTFSEWWPCSSMSVSTLGFALSSPSGSGFNSAREIQVHTPVDGRDFDLLPLLLEALIDRSLLAHLVGDAEGSWSIRGSDGFRFDVPFRTLRSLLPLLTAIEVDKSGRRLRTLDFGVLEIAQAGTDSRLSGGQELVDLAQELMKVPDTLPASTLEAIQGTARPYQVFGVNWCAVRRKHGLGGIVGDEYAVGKTLQGLLAAFGAYHEAEAGENKTSLIVVTKTLLYEGRWQEDARKFLPGMRLLEVASGRQVPQLEAAASFHCVLTTYDVLMRYLDAFARRTWNVVACDEAHKLANGSALKSRAVKTLKARQKLALTGSPMQNHPGELWSLMDIVVPGLLRHKAWFDRTFPKVRATIDAETGLAREVEPEVARAAAAKLVALGKLIGPFYLRRTNDDLGRTLPMINDVRRDVSLPQEQSNLYELVRVGCSAEVQALLAEAGFEKSRASVLAKINQLRLACAEPSLLQKGTIGAQTSAKRRLAVDLCQELVADGKKVVVVSEWVGVLDKLVTDLRSAGLAAQSIHGDVSGKRRQTLCEQFRTGGPQVLMVQLLLAEGIELPEGDAIVLYEPWWNQKREEQAIARLRRDERDKHVTVVRLVVPGSIESSVERIGASKLLDIEAVMTGRSVGASQGFTMADLNEALRPLDTSKHGRGTASDFGEDDNDGPEATL